MEEAEEVQQEPLLSEAIQQPFKQHGDACPGCALELHKLTRQGAPTKELVLVAVLVLCNALPISSLFPFIYFMVEDFGVAETESQIAFYAGFIGSAYMAGRFLSGTPWGIVADKYGRKPVMICGTASIVVFNTLFGFSTAFWMALATRFFLGMFNGLLGTIRRRGSIGLKRMGRIWSRGINPLLHATWLLDLQL